MRNKTKQRGIALLILTIIMALAAITYFLTVMSPAEIHIEQKQKTAQILKQAKSALIAYVLTKHYVLGQEGKIGKLPCPDYVDNAADDGEQDAACGNAYGNAIGFFPWRTLGLDLLDDGDGTCLLYAVSPAYKNDPGAALTPDSYGQFQILDSTGAVIQGANPEDRPVAIIFAPGKALAGQSRSYDSSAVCGLDYGNISAYLDNDGITDNAAIDPGVANIIDRFVQSYTGSEDAASPLNDRFITISHSDIWTPILALLATENFNSKMRNLTEALAMCLAEYAKYNFNEGHTRSLPWPAAMDLNGNEYRNSYDYDDNIDAMGGYAGRLPYQVLNSNAAIDNDLTEPTPPPNPGFIEYSPICDSLWVNGGTIEIDLTDKLGEYWNLWSNWKEYFFYVLSKNYSPDNTGADCTVDCINIETIDYAGAVIYSGMKDVGQNRYAPPFDAALAPDGNDKDEIVNYLEGGRELMFLNILGTGIGAYTSVNTGTDLSDDIMFCINYTDMSVVSCLP